MTNELVMRGNGLQKEENREGKGSLLSTAGKMESQGAREEGYKDRE